MPNKIIVENNSITINNHKIVLPYKIADVLDVENDIIVRIEPEIGHVLNNNIYCFTKKCMLKWTIQEISYKDSEDNPFVAMQFTPNGDLVVSNWSGMNYIVNILNGFITPYSFTK